MVDTKVSKLCSPVLLSYITAVFYLLFCCSNGKEEREVLSNIGIRDLTPQESDSKQQRSIKRYANNKATQDDTVR